MTSRANTRIMACLLSTGACVAMLPAAFGEQANSWRIGNSRDGMVTASVLSTGTLSGGSSRVIEYHPIFTIGCHPTDLQWIQSVQLKDPVSGDQTVDLTLRIDGDAVSEQWMLGFQKRSFSRDGDDGVTRLLGAKRLKVVWRFGFLAGTGEADFNLTGIREALTRIAGMCGGSLPQGAG